MNRFFVAGHYNYFVDISFLILIHMRNKFHHPGIVLIAIAVTLFLPANSFATQKVPITFNDYHGYTQTADYLKKVAAAYPSIAELVEIGRSNSNRPVYILIITNRSTGEPLDKFVNLSNERKEGVKNVPPMPKHTAKPGHFISGTTHGNEFTGNEVCLYIIDKLVSGYGDDQSITAMVDKKSFYICPIINADGAYSSLEGGIPRRGNNGMTDDDKDGKVNEDGPDDLNGDKRFSMFRYKDPKGEWVIDEKEPRLMVRTRGDSIPKEKRYSVIMEDKDNDGDGKRGEDSEAGIDINRNFPEGWWNEEGMPGGLGDYPTSEPEIRAIAEFFTNHRNILIAQFYHTSGGFVYRPPCSFNPDEMNKSDVAVFDMVFGKKYLEILDLDMPEAWKDPSRLDEIKADLARTDANKFAKARGYVMPLGWRSSYDEDADKIYGYGIATDWAYRQYGMWSVTPELWNPAHDLPGFPAEAGNDRTAAQRYMLEYQDKNYGGKFFMNWIPFKHPELGDGELGGWISPYSLNNAFPGEPLLAICEQHWQFEKYMASLLPEMEISSASAKLVHESNATMADAKGDGTTFTVSKGKKIGKYRIVEVKAVIRNNGALATHTAEGMKLPGNREDVVWLVSDTPGSIEYLDGSPWQKMGSLGGSLKVPGVKMGPSMKEVRWTVALKGDAKLKIVASSQKGGTVVQELTIK